MRRSNAFFSQSFDSPRRLNRRRCPFTSRSKLCAESQESTCYTPPTRPPWWRRQSCELKKLIFLPPRKCPIDLFGPVANATILKRLQAARIFASVLHTASEPSRRARLWLLRAQRQLNAATSGGIEQHYTSHSHDTIENLVLLRAVTAQTATGRRQSNEAIPAAGSFDDATPTAAAAAVV